MKDVTVGLLTLAGVIGCGAWASPAATLEDIQFWVGRGTNRAALVIDWRDGKQPACLVWGYRWNGTATGLDMLRSVVAADGRLFAHLGQFGWGTAILGLGYDRNDSGDFGVTPGLVFDSGGLAVDAGAANANDARQPTDSADHFAEGWNSGFWAYFTKATSAQPWESSWVGAADRLLADGAWDGYSFAAWFDSAPPSEPAPALSSPFAVGVLAAQGPFGASPYDDPASLLGRPSTNFYDPWAEWSGSSPVRRVKLVEPAYNLDATQTRKLVTTLHEGSVVILRFEQPIRDDPAHPYGIDLLVFGNAAYWGSGLVNDSTDLNTYRLTGGGFFEPLKVSVSPGYTGGPGQDPTNWATWDWYRYETGPYADTAFPTHAYRWDRTHAVWTDQLMDFTKPVNPVLGALLNSGESAGLSAADAIDLYDGSGGGTGFDLAESGFASIQYVKIEGLPGFEGGEVDAVSSVRPMVLGDSLTVAPANLTNGTATLYFQQPGRPSQTALVLEFTALSGLVRVVTSPLAEPEALAPYGQLLNGASFEVTALLSSNLGPFRADVRLVSGPDYDGTGQDLALLRQAGSRWEPAAFSFDSATRSAVVPGVTNPAAFALLRVRPAGLCPAIEPDASGHRTVTVRFAAVAGWTYALERTTDFVHWVEVASSTPSAVGWTALGDTPTAPSAFYRVRVSRP